MSHSLKTNRVAFRPSMGETTTGLEERISPAHVSVAAVGFQLPGHGTGSLTAPQLRAVTAPKATAVAQLPGHGTGSLTAPQLRATAAPSVAAGTYQLPGHGTGSLTAPQLRGFFHK